eukprot:UN00218
MHKQQPTLKTKCLFLIKMLLHHFRQYVPIIHHLNTTQKYMIIIYLLSIIYYVYY